MVFFLLPLYYFLMLKAIVIELHTLIGSIKTDLDSFSQNFDYYW